LTGRLNLRAPEGAEQIARERDLYRGLLELGSEDDPGPFLKKALELITGLLGAARGYVELFDRDNLDSDQANSFCAVGFPDDRIQQVRSLVSHGIIGEAIATEHVVMTPSALLDPRFRDRESVKQSRIDAVICAPIGSNPPRGVLYLESAAAQQDVLNEQSDQAERFARYLAPLAEQFTLRRRVRVGCPISELRKKLGAEDFIGTSQALVRLFQEVQAIAHLDVSVLLSGETGTGKTQLARLIHQNSRRASGPFMEINCATLPDQLVESELFGAMAGSHSTASRRIEGKVSAASQGTILLDEIAELSMSAQAKLLQLLQSKEYFPLGASRALKADVRVIAASNVDLDQAVAERRFRQDLYYRLQVLSIRLPSLSERGEDVAILAQYFCERAQRLHGLPGVRLSPAALRAVENAVWPGNIRELSNVVEAATIRAAGEAVRQVEVTHLFPDPRSGQESGPVLTFQEETRRFQAELLRKALEANDWNVSAAARRLDLTRAHVYNLIKSFDLSR
jgi:Nif-specific regulatory protein